MNEEKKVKTTTPKKKTTTTKKTNTEKKEVKKATKATEKKTTSVKKVSEKKEVKPVSKPKTVKKVTVKEENKVTKPKTVKKEVIVKEVKLPEEKPVVKETKVVTSPVKAENVSEEIKEVRRKRYLFEAIIIAILAIIVLVLLFNKTFLGLNYKTDKVNISVPRFTYFVSDEDNEVKFVTLRKSDYLKEYYNEYLEGFIFYSCSDGKNTFYYNEQTKTLIKEIDIEKKFAIKKIEIEYDSRTPEEVCGLR